MTPPPAEAAAYHVTCPQEVRANNHKDQTGKWWKSAEWKAVKDAYLKTHKRCEYCGKPSEIVHHDEAWMYHDKEAYFNPENFTPACNRCHYEYRIGRKICPQCGEHYVKRTEEVCMHCRGIRRPGTNYVYRYRLKHQCAHRTGNQRCSRDGRTFMCVYSSATGKAKCEHFQERSVKA